MFQFLKRRKPKASDEQIVHIVKKARGITGREIKKQLIEQGFRVSLGGFYVQMARLEDQMDVFGYNRRRTYYGHELTERVYMAVDEDQILISEYVRDELEARCLTPEDAVRSCEGDPRVNALHLTFLADDGVALRDDIPFTENDAKFLSQVFPETSAETWMNLSNQLAERYHGKTS